MFLGKVGEARGDSIWGIKGACCGGHDSPVAGAAGEDRLRLMAAGFPGVYEAFVGREAGPGRGLGRGGVNPDPARGRGGQVGFALRPDCCLEAGEARRSRPLESCLPEWKSLGRCWTPESNRRSAVPQKSQWVQANRWICLVMAPGHVLREQLVPQSH